MPSVCSLTLSTASTMLSTFNAIEPDVEDVQPVKLEVGVGKRPLQGDRSSAYVAGPGRIEFMTMPATCTDTDIVASAKTFCPH